MPRDETTNFEASLTCDSCGHTTALTPEELEKIAKILRIEVSAVTEFVLSAALHMFKCAKCGEKNVSLNISKEVELAKGNKTEKVKQSYSEKLCPEGSEEEKFADAKPSETTEVFWVTARRKRGKYPRGSIRRGKWLIFAPKEKIDDVWLEIKRATEEGELGASSKVATARPTRLSKNKDEFVICVYTYDWTDAADARYIRQRLRELGVTQRIAYKSDEDTHMGKYRVRGHSRISKYYE
jgi:hypothetical protein